MISTPQKKCSEGVKAYKPDFLQCRGIHSTSFLHCFSSVWTFPVVSWSRTTTTDARTGTGCDRSGPRRQQQAGSPQSLVVERAQVDAHTTTGGGTRLEKSADFSFHQQTLTFVFRQREFVVAELDSINRSGFVLSNNGSHTQQVVVKRIGEERKVSVKGWWIHPHLNRWAAGQKTRERDALALAQTLTVANDGGIHQQEVGYSVKTFSR